MKKNYVTKLFFLLSTFFINAQIPTENLYSVNEVNFIRTDGDHIFFNLTNNKNQIFKLDEASPNNSPLVATVGAGKTIQNFIVKGNDLYTLSTDDLGKPELGYKNLTMPSADIETLLNGEEFSNQGITIANELAINNSKLFVFKNEGIEVFSSDLSNPVPQFSLLHQNSDDGLSYDIQSTDDYLYYSIPPFEYKRVNINDQNEIQSLGGFDNDFILDFFVINDNELILTSGLGQISFYHLTFEDFTSPTKTELVLDKNFQDVGNMVLTNSGEVYFIDETNSVIKFSLPSLSSKDFTISNSIKLYPNPSTSYLALNGLNVEKEYSIYNGFGVKIMKGKISPNSKLDTSMLSSGLYFFKLDGQKNTMKFIKK